MDACAECGFRYDVTPVEEIGPAIRSGTGDVALLLETGSDLARRRDPDIWSPIEYACHLRDTLLVQRERVLLARRVDCPAAVPMGRDERVEHEGYAEQDPVDVARQLTDAAALLANVLARLPEPDWPRTILFTYPEPAERTLSWLAAHTLHEVRHHRLDINRQL